MGSSLWTVNRELPARKNALAVDAKARVATGTNDLMAKGRRVKKGVKTSDNC
jgi:hypothetical protein